MKAELVHIDKVNHNVRTFWFKPAGQIKYTAGQFIEMYLPHGNPDERGERHWFTLSSSPTDKFISITTKIVEPPSLISTFKRTLKNLKPGDAVDISAPMGDFVLPKDKNIPLVFVAGGIGVTPFHSIVKWLVDNGEKRHLQVILAANTLDDVIFKDLFVAYELKPILVISDPPENWDGIKGPLSGDKILSLIGDSRDKRIYLSGPEPMVESLFDDLKQKVDENQLVGDYFPGYQANLQV